MNDIQMGGSNLPSAPSVQTAAVMMREAQSVQAAIFMARQYPRDQGVALKRIEGACARVKLAEQAQYSYPKGGTNVSGPSIRLAEMLALNWGNIDYGVNVLERANGESTIEAYCWDLEANTRRLMRFKIAHVRDTRKGSYALTDQREIYELEANQGSRRVRACILGVIPGDIVEAAQEACDRTLAGAGSLAEKRTKIIAAFKEVEITADEIERRLGKKMTALSDIDYVQLRKIWKSLHDGMSKKEDWFAAILDPQKVAKESAAAANVPPPANAQEDERKRKERKVTLDELDREASRIIDAGGDPWKVLGIPEGAEMGAYTTDGLQTFADKLKGWKQ